MARKISYQHGPSTEALAQEMRRDQSVFIMGEDNYWRRRRARRG